MPPPIIAGLYPYTRGGITSPPRFVLQEIEQSLQINPSYRTDLLVLAGDVGSAHILEGFGLRVHRSFDDAPEAIRRDTAHKMKHWMCRWALQEFGEFLWVDWDTVLLRPLDEGFWSVCKSSTTPRFVWIDDYWATVNCGVYYASDHWLPAMERSFEAQVTEPNDELLWASVLPADVRAQEMFWWGDRVVQISDESDFAKITTSTYLAHVKHLEWADAIRNSSK
jgi:hypothetical protein